MTESFILQYLEKMGKARIKKLFTQGTYNAYHFYDSIIDRNDATYALISPAASTIQSKRKRNTAAKRFFRIRWLENEMVIREQS